MKPRILLWAVAAGVVSLSTAKALYIEDFSAAVNNRFSSGWKTSSMTTNTSGSFLGLGYDWSGVGWDSNDNSRGLTMLSPGHYLGASHSSPSAGTNYYWSSTGSLVSAVRDTSKVYVSNSDIMVGTLVKPLPASSGVTYYKLLDLGSDPQAYVGKTVLLYGHGGSTSSNVGNNSPRIGTSQITSISATGTSNGSSFSSGTSPHQIYSVGGDSSSPTFVPWVNPVTGQKQLNIVGGRWYPTMDSFIADPTKYTGMNWFMGQTGYSLRWTPSTIHNTWSGGTDGTWGAGANWNGAAPQSSDYILFKGDVAGGHRTVTLGADRQVQGIYFQQTAATGDGFTFASGNTLTVGRGGITNLDNDHQVVNANISSVSTDPLYIEAGAAGMTFKGTINNNSKLLTLHTAGTSSAAGGISGSGGFAKDGEGVLIVSGSNTYTGTTFIHAGKLMVNNASGSGTGTGAVSVESGAVLGGKGGRISGAVTVMQGGFLSSEGVLTLQSGLSLSGTLIASGTFSGGQASFTQIQLQGGSLLLAATAALDLVFDSSINFSDDYWKSARSWTLIDNTGSGTLTSDASLNSWNELVGVGTFAVQAANVAGGDLILSFTPVPEPAIERLCGLGIIGAIFLRRKVKQFSKI